MNYYAVTFNITSADDTRQAACDLLAAEAAEAGFESFEDNPTGITGYVQTELFNRQELDRIISDFAISEAKISYEVNAVEQQDWNEAWENEGFDPIFVGDRCVIYDSRHLAAEQLSSFIAPLRIGIEARMAFGTGTHETTRMVVARMLDCDISGKRVLDCGCGTGILSIVAAKLGAEDIVTYDIDDWSVDNTRHNSELNGVENITVLQGDSSVLSHVCGLFDVVVANINRNVLLADMWHFADVLAEDGRLILSGFYSDDATSITEEAAKHGLKLLDSAEDNQWACLTFAKD